MAESLQQDLDSILDRQRQALLDGSRPTIESLLDCSPFTNDREAQLDLIYNEIVVLEELGEHPVFDEYVLRYPQLEQDLRLHFEIHRAVNGDLGTTDHLHGHDTWPEFDEDRFVPGMKLGEYEIVRQIGQGGMAVVYRAHDCRLHRDVALKMFQPRRAPTQREALRFQGEAEAMARLAHPNIVRIFEVGRCEGRPYLSLELAEQGTLAQRLQRTVFTPQGAANLIETLARAIHHAHEHQVVHRDLKPANILYTSDGTPKITDFGLAKVLDDDFHSPRDVTRTGEPVGTPRYMAPEQASGQHNRIGPSTDVYALGTLLYECLTGKAPFVATSVVDTLQMIRTDDPVSPRRLQSSIPRDLATICLHCLEKEPGRRYPSALALATDLRRFQQGEPINARPTPNWERAWKWCRRRPAHAALITVGLLFSVATLAVIVVGKQAESRRIKQLRFDVAELVRDGQTLLEHGEADVAYGRFHEAWLIVQAEPALEDHRPGVGGWLDHSRNAINQQQWKQRVPPREFDERRDLALLESLLLDPLPEAPIATVRESIRGALELTIAGDPAWQRQRQRLVLVEADLIARDASAEQALAYLDATREFPSRLFHEYRARFQAQIGQQEDAERARAQAALFPQDAAESLFMRGMDRIRQRDFPTAMINFDELITLEPEHYTARLFQAVCFLNLKRPGEARVALTACIAQRPGLYCNYYFRAQALMAMGESRLAVLDLQRVLEMNPSKPVHSATDSLMSAARIGSVSSTPNTATEQ